MQPHGTARREGRRSRSGVATALVEREPRQLTPGVVHHGAGELHEPGRYQLNMTCQVIFSDEESAATSATVTPSSSSWRHVCTRHQTAGRLRAAPSYTSDSGARSRTAARGPSMAR